MTAATAEDVYAEHAVVPTVNYHCGRAATLTLEVQKLNKAIARKNRRIAKLRRIELENDDLHVQLKKARALLDLHGVDWK